MKRYVVAGCGALFLALLLGLSYHGQSSAPSNPTAALAPAAALPAPRTSTSLAIGKLMVHGLWGSDPGQFGRKHAQEDGSPEAPMAIAAHGGEVDVVDQVNRRVQRFKDGRLIGTITVGSDAIQDVAPMRGGRTALLDRLADGNVSVYGPDGKLENQLPIVGKGIAEGGEVTGVFADDSGLYLERDHGSLVRVGNADGTVDADRPEMLGRPSRDGRYALQVEIANRDAGELVVRATDRQTGQVAWTQTVKADAPLVHVVMLDSDRSGNVYVGAEVGSESTQEPYELYDVHTMAARLSSTGTPRGQLRLPALGEADETFRPLTVDDDGVLYLMAPDNDGMQLLRYVFP
jgi:hypothetical protein